MLFLGGKGGEFAYSFFVLWCSSVVMGWSSMARDGFVGVTAYFENQLLLLFSL